MSRKDIAMEHPMGADRHRMNKARDIAEDSKKIFQKLDEHKKQEKVEETDLKIVNQSKVKNIKDLLHFGVLSKVIELEGFFFKIKTLSNQDIRLITKKILLMSDEDRLIESNILHLAASLVAINGLSISEAYVELLEKESEASDVEKNMEILSILNANLVGKLIEEYFKLAAESKTILDTGNESEIKDTLKSLKK